MSRLPPNHRQLTTTASGAVGNQRKYGDIDDSDFVHDEIKELGKQIKAQMDQYQIRDEASLLNNLRQFGPSEQSKAQLRKELEGARQALETGIYIVYRNVAPPKINPRTGKPFMSSRNEECCRIGPSHRCFCNHSLAEHGQQQQQKQITMRGAGGGGGGGGGGIHKKPPGCSLCPCTCFTYIPNQPEEVGDGFLSRRRGFVAEAWSAKCKCSHGSKSHDPVTKSCRECRGCYGFESQFLCGVCDGRWEDHMTIVETESERRGQNLSVGNDFIPLAGVDQEFREIVFGEETARALPPTSSSSKRQIMGGGGNNALAPIPSSSSSSSSMTKAQRQHTMMHQQQHNQIQQQPRHINDSRVQEVGYGNNNNDDDGIEFPSQRIPQKKPTSVAPMMMASSSSSNDTPQQITCPGCNQINRKLAKFCRACGGKL